MNLILLALLTFTTSLYNDNIVASANINLWFIMILLVYNVIKDRYISVSSIFIFGFIYIFIKEFLNDTPTLFLDWGKQNVVTGYFVIMYSFISLQVGYHSRDFLKKVKYLNKVEVTPQYIKNRKTFFRLNIFLVYAIFVGNIFLVIEGLTEGRPNAFKYGILSSVSYALALVAIVNFKLYFKQFYGKNNYINTLINTFPLFVLFIASGTRFLLLFGIIALVSDNLVNLSNKKMLKIASFVFVFALLSNLVLELRNVGFLNSNQLLQSKSLYEEKTLNQSIVNKFTNEGMLRNAAMITDYLNKHENTYGESIAFLSYWWVPRTLWENKPTQLDFWLIREYTSEYSDSGYSTASGFFGELYMDFGKYFTMPLLIILGYFFSYLNFRFIINQSKLNYSSILISSSILAWIFFLVRSIMTSTFLIMFVILSAYLLSKLLKKWNILN